ncbi:MAG: replication initiation protein [Pseudomonadota bacterium]
MAQNPRLTINQKGSGEATNPDGWGTLVKPGELIDIVEVTPLTLNDRRIYNCLLASAWDTIGDDKQHSIRKADLRFNHNGTDRLDASIERLMGAIVKVRDENGDITRVQLLGANTENEKRDGVFRYRFDRELRNIIQNSRVFARIRAEVTFALSSKYALALYEMIQKRGNLEYKHSEEFAIDDLRALLGVPKDKLTSFADFKRRALIPAVKEVNALGDFGVQLVPLKTGRAVTGIRLHWHQKSEEELKAAYQELMRHRAGRQARIDGRAETIADDFAQQVIR